MIQSVQRAIELVVAVSRAGEASLQEIAAAAKLHPTTVHHLLQTLVATGMLEKQPSPPRYRIGPLVLELAQHRENRTLAAAAEGALRQLAEAYGAGIFTLSEVIGGDVLATVRVLGERAGVVERPRGSAMHPYGSASSLVFQAWWSAEERAAFQERHPFWEQGGHLWASLEQLEEALQGYRARGVVVREYAAHAQVLVAAPVLGGGGRVVGAIGAAVPKAVVGGAGRRTLIERVKQAAGACSSNGGGEARDSGKRRSSC